MTVDRTPDEEERERRTAEIARVARELAGYGFYVVGEFLPPMNRPRSPEPGRGPPSASGGDGRLRGVVSPLTRIRPRTRPLLMAPVRPEPR